MSHKPEKNNIPRILTISLSFFVCLYLQGQISLPGEPLPAGYPGLKPLIVYSIDIPETVTTKSASVDVPLFKIEDNGLLIDVDYNIYSAGTWDTIRDGTRVWRAAFSVDGAVTMNIVFDRFIVRKGVRVYITDMNGSDYLGAFSDINNKPGGLFSTGILKTGTAAIEIHVPGYIDDPGEINISGIGCSLTQGLKSALLKDGWFGLSGDCNADINCYDQYPYNFSKNSVVRIIFNGGQRCTGTLVNNTGQDGENYILTAKHCIGTEYLANTAVFYFGYESPSCSGPDGNSSFSASGATIVSKTDNLDFVLLKLLEDIPFYYRPVYAGWDVTGNSPASGYSIHHPLGDVKKISFENHQLLSTTFSSQFTANSHWLVRHWETGVTEEGSSGSAFFNPSGRVVGTLTGGQAVCGSPVNDYYQKMSYSWDYYPDSDEQLKYWLDPLNSGVELTDAFDPYAGLWETGDTLTNIANDEVLTVESYNLAWGSLSGHNSRYLRQFAEKFDSGNGRTIFGAILQTDRNYVASTSARMRVRVWSGQDKPAQILYDKLISLADLSGNSFNFIQFDTAVQVTGVFFVGYQLFYDNPQDTFSLKMASGRTIDEINTAYVQDGVTWYALDEFTQQAVHSSFAIMPVVYDIVNPDPPPKRDIIYPNPATDEFNIRFENLPETDINLSVYNVTGQIIYQKTFPALSRVIKVTGLHSFSPGFYIVKVSRDSMTANYRLIVVR